MRSRAFALSLVVQYIPKMLQGVPRDMTRNEHRKIRRFITRLNLRLITKERVYHQSIHRPAFINPQSSPYRAAKQASSTGSPASANPPQHPSASPSPHHAASAPQPSASHSPSVPQPHPQQPHQYDPEHPYQDLTADLGPPAPCPPGSGEYPPTSDPQRRRSRRCFLSRRRRSGSSCRPCGSGRLLRRRLWRWS